MEGKHWPQRIPHVRSVRSRRIPSYTLALLRSLNGQSSSRVQPLTHGHFAAFLPLHHDIIRAAEYQKIDAASQSVSLSAPG